MNNKLTYEELDKHILKLTLETPPSNFIVMTYCRGRGKITSFDNLTSLCGDPECDWCDSIHKGMLSYNKNEL